MFGGLDPIPNTVLQDHFIFALIDAGMIKINCPECRQLSTVSKKIHGRYRMFACPNCGTKVEASHPRFHDLRHSHATLLLDQGVPISAVSQRLGHSSITITTKTYLHATKSAVTALIEKLPDLHFGNNLGNNSLDDIKKTLN
jgi:transposase-like protein